MLISFSGPDGVGKTTQINLLLKYLSSLDFKCCSVYDISPDIRYHKQKDLLLYYQYFQPYDVIHTRFRMNSDANDEIMNKLENNSFIPNKDLANQAAQQGYVDACEWFKIVINPLQLEKERIFIYDRYIWDEIVFKTFYGCSLEYMENLYIHEEKPQLSLVLTANVTTVKDRNSKRPDSRTTLYKSYTYIQQLNELFTQITTTHQLHQINAEGLPIDIHKNIIKLINPLLPVKK